MCKGNIERIDTYVYTSSKTILDYACFLGLRV